MSTYIKQLIDANGNNLIPVSGTASCYNSYGLTVDEIIENLKSDMKGIIPITWAELKPVSIICINFVGFILSNPRKSRIIF